MALTFVSSAHSDTSCDYSIINDSHPSSWGEPQQAPRGLSSSLYMLQVSRVQSVNDKIQLTGHLSFVAIRCERFCMNCE